MHDSHLVKANSWTQSNIALSSGEAEFYALVATASEALGLVAVMEDSGDKTEAHLYADASAAIGVANQEELGGLATSMLSRSGFSRRFGSAGWVWERCSAPRTQRTSLQNMLTQSCWASTYAAWDVILWPRRAGATNCSGGRG